VTDTQPTAPTVSEQQLTHLLAAGHESSTVDFKERLDLRNKHDLVELAKDIGAMQVDGGYIVIGADSQGTPMPPGVPAADLQMFDEANLRPKLMKWLPDGFEIRTAHHTIGGCTFVVIYAMANQDGFSVFRADGQYESPRGPVTVFRQGDVFVRHGTSSERWAQADISRLFDRRVAALKDQWRADRQEDLEDLLRARGAQALVQGPSENYTWRLDAETFDLATTELLRTDDDIPLQRALNAAVGDSRAVIQHADIEELETLIGRIATVIAQAITYDRRRWIRAGLDTLTEIYRLGFDLSLFASRTVMRPETLWLTTVEHLLAIGALATRRSDWETVKDIVVRPPGDQNDYHRTWLRHGLTMGARAQLLETKSLITLAAERAKALPALRPELAPEDDRLISSICQFDLLAALTIIGETESLTTSNWYTNFARFYTTRATPVVEKLLADERMRATLFPHSDDFLAQALREVDRMATNQGAMFDGWYGWWQSNPVTRFLEKHPAP
jgi:hypothetical protein